MPIENLDEYFEWCCWSCKTYKIIPDEKEQKGIPHCCYGGIERALTLENSFEENKFRESIFNICNQRGWYNPKK